MCVCCVCVCVPACVVCVCVCSVTHTHTLLVLHVHASRPSSHQPGFPPSLFCFFQPPLLLPSIIFMLFAERLFVLLTLLPKILKHFLTSQNQKFNIPQHFWSKQRLLFVWPKQLLSRTPPPPHTHTHFAA